MNQFDITKFGQEIFPTLLPIVYFVVGFLLGRLSKWHRHE